MARAEQMASARSRAYGLLSHLYLRGLTPAVQAQVESVAEFRAALPVSFDQEQASATHQQIFDLGVFPYQSLYLDPSFLLGGAESGRVRQFYARAGYVVDERAGEQDHIGHELAFLAFLSGAEADAQEDGQMRAAHYIRSLQQAFLDEHLLWWLPCFACAVQRQSDPFYAAVAEITQDLATAHRLALRAEGGMPGAAGSDEQRLPSCTMPLNNPDAGLPEIVATLTAPTCVGVYLSRHDIAHMARACGLPRGFGDRRLLLTNLLRAAGEFGGVAPLAAAFGAVADDFAAAYRRFAAHGAPFTTIGQVWEVRVANLRNLLAQLAGIAED